MTAEHNDQEGLPQSTDLVSSGSGLPTVDNHELAVTTPVEAMVTRYRVLRSVSLSLAEIPLLSSPKDRTLAYIQIGGAMLTTGTAQLGLVLTRAQQEAEDFRRTREYIKTSQPDLPQPPLEVEAAQDVAQVLFGIVQLALQSGSRNTSSIMEGLYNHISGYDASLEDDAVKKILNEYQTGGVDFARRTNARIQDLTSLAVLAHSFNYDESFVRRIIDQINQARDNPNVIKTMPREEYLKILNCCLKLNVEIGDLDEARRILYLIEQIPSHYTSSSHPKVSEQIPAQKIIGLTSMAVVEGLSLATEAQSLMPSQEEVLAILRSGRTEAIRALGYLQLATEEDLVSLELPDIDQALEALQGGIDERMLSIKLIASERLAESDARRHLTSKEAVEGINPLAELDSFFQELEQRIPQEYGYEQRIYIVRLILRSWHDGLKSFIAKEGQRIQALGSVVGRPQLIRQVIGSLPYDGGSDGFALLCNLSFYGLYGLIERGEEKHETLGVVSKAISDLVPERIKQNASLDMYGGIIVKNFPEGVNFRITHYPVGGRIGYTALNIYSSQKALGIIAETEPLPTVQWTGDQSQKPTDQEINDEISHLNTIVRIKERGFEIPSIQSDTASE